MSISSIKLPHVPNKGGVWPRCTVLSVIILYNLLRLDRTPSKSTFIDLISNYYLVIHRIASMAMKQVSTPKSPIFCIFATLQDMLHMCGTIYGDLTDLYGVDIG